MSKQSPMYLLLVGVPVAGVIVPYVTPISASMRPKLEVHVHFMFLYSPFFKESFATELTTVSLVFISRVHGVHVSLHVSHLDPAEIALLGLLHAVPPDVTLKTHLVVKPLATFLTATLLSNVFLIHVIEEST